MNKNKTDLHTYMCKFNTENNKHTNTPISGQCIMSLTFPIDMNMNVHLIPVLVLCVDRIIKQLFVSTKPRIKTNNRKIHLIQQRIV